MQIDVKSMEVARTAPVKSSSETDRQARKRRRRSAYAKSEVTRRKILDVAASLFSRKGYASTSLRDIAGRTQIMSGSIYYYFASKEEILDAVLQEGLHALQDAVKQAVEALPKDCSPRQQLETAIQAHLAAVLSKSDYIRANVSEFQRAPRAIRARNLQLRQEYANYWRSLLDRAQKSKDIRANVDLSLLRLFIIGALNWSADWFNPKKQPVEKLAAKMFDYIYSGVGPARRT